MTIEQYLIVNDSCSVVWIILSLIGIVSNIIIIKTFITMGLNDGVIISFLALAVFDLSYLIVSFCLGVATVFYVVEFRYKLIFPIEPFGIKVFFFNIMILINVCNMLTTTYLAVARCMCIVKPLQFKNTFTSGRAIMVMAGIALFAVCSYTPLLANMAMKMKFDRKLNTSRPSLWLSAYRESIKVIVWTLMEMALPLVTEVIVIVCIIVMADSLRASARFRQSSTTVSHITCESNHHGDSKKTNPDFSKIPDKLTGKDLRVVQQVVLISVVYIICNTPKILVSVFTNVEREFAIGRTYSILYLAVNSLGKHFEVFNSAVNIIIYYAYNTKFRTVLREKYTVTLAS